MRDAVAANSTLIRVAIEKQIFTAPKFQLLLCRNIEKSPAKKRNIAPTKVASLLLVTRYCSLHLDIVTNYLTLTQRTSPSPKQLGLEKVILASPG